MALFVLLEALLQLKGDWRCSLLENGVQCVIITGMFVKQMWLVINLDLTPVMLSFHNDYGYAHLFVCQTDGEILTSVEPGTGQIFIDRLNCTGFENGLINCSFPAIGNLDANCDHSKDVGISCIGKPDSIFMMANCNNGSMVAIVYDLELYHCLHIL